MDFSIAGRICLVSGATRGIGRAIAYALAQRGATVVLVARSPAAGEIVAADIQQATGNTQVSALQGDLASQASIRQLADEFRRRHDRLHVLVNCAGAFKARRELSPDGIELMFATNHLGYFLLTHLLLDPLKVSAPATVLNVTAPSTTKPDFDDLQGERSFRALWQFGATKMENLLFTFALARRLEGSGVTANAVHPGVARTELMRETPMPFRLFTGVLNLFAPSPARAAEDAAEVIAGKAATANGQFFHRGESIAAPEYAHDQDAQERLWGISLRLCGLEAG
jgi:NAD(P)-dependent dehydrogenase (short-subunit alcohol dehydrogenase family)